MGNIKDSIWRILRKRFECATEDGWLERCQLFKQLPIKPGEVSPLGSQLRIREVL